MKSSYFCAMTIFFALSFLVFSAKAQQYILQDHDVVIENGVIQSCSYDFAIKNIIIPNVLMGQTVVGIVDSEGFAAGVFVSKGIESITFPVTLEYIGNDAFQRNNISYLDLGGLASLKRIGVNAFYECNITSLSLDGCASLESIERQAFIYNEIASLNLNQCTSLIKIGNEAFRSNLIENLQIEGCTNLITINSRAFADNLINSLNLSACTALRSIGFYAFSDNNISDIDISNCGQLTFINTRAFSNNNISGIILPACLGYESYGWKDQNDNSFSVESYVTDLSTFYYVAYTYTLKDEDVIVEDNAIQSCSYDFWFKSLLIPEMLDGQVIISIRDGVQFDDGVFSYNDITDAHLPSTIEYIGDYAFGANPVGDMDLSAHTKLEYIGVQALSAGYELILPVCSEYESYGWMDSDGSAYNGGDTIQNHGKYLYVPYPYILKDEDVVIENGVIQSCGYSFVHKDIIMPETLQNQTVIGIADAESPTDGVFYFKPITSIQIPRTIKNIGSWAFAHNNILDLDLSDCIFLKSLGDHAFDYNHTENLDLSNCSNLIVIGDHAFGSHSLLQLDLSDCLAIESIGSWALSASYSSSHNKLIDLNLSGCSNLQSICNYAFGGNDIVNLDLSECTSLTYIGSKAFYGNKFDSFILPLCEGYEVFGWKDQNGNFYYGEETVSDLLSLYYVSYDYILKDEDVEIENGSIQKCLYNFRFKSIIIPESLQGQVVKQIADKANSSNDAFGRKKIVKIQLPSSIEVIGNYAFSNNLFLNLDFSQCSDLLKIGESAFAATFHMNTLDLSGCSSLRSISDYAFIGNSFDSVAISDCNSLMHIGSGAFTENGPDSFILPINYEYESYGWKDNIGNIYSGGDLVTNSWNLSYYVPYTYTLQDYDIAIEDGFIKSCSYDFLVKDIVIPDTLQQQKVVGISDGTDSVNGVFASKNIISIDIPYTLKYIGDFAFYNNQLNSFDLENYSKLWYIGANSFNENGFDQVILPEPSYPGFDFWEGGDGNTHNSGEVVSDLIISYTAVGVASTVTFMVQNADENPIDNAEIEFYQQRLTSDIFGKAIFKNVFSGDHEYQVSKSGYTTENGEVNISVNDTTISVTLIGVGIHEPHLNEISLYPNPVSNILNFNTIINPSIVEIYNIYGESVIQMKSPVGDAINVSSLNRGMYIVKMVFVNGRIITERFLKD